MSEQLPGISAYNINPISLHFHVPPAIWRGDPLGHIGKTDLFFWVLEGEVILFIDSKYYLVKAGQLAFLPMGKMRKYTQVSKNFSMYEMRFFAEYEGKNLMNILGLDEQNLVVDIPNKEEMSRLFEASCYREMFKGQIHYVSWCANILNIIKIFHESIEKQNSDDNKQFEPVIEYMKENLDKSLGIEELSDIVHLQPTYFIRRFKKFFGVPPMMYFANMRIHRAMELLLTTNEPIDYIAKSIGIDDTSYFSRWFKKNSSLSPSEYRKIFIKNG